MVILDSLRCTASAVRYSGQSGSMSGSVDRRAPRGSSLYLKTTVWFWGG